MKNQTYFIKYKIFNKDVYAASVSYSYTLQDGESDRDACDKTIERVQEERGNLVQDIEAINCTELKLKIEEAVSSQFPNATPEEKYNIAFITISCIYG